MKEAYAVSEKIDSSQQKREARGRTMPTLLGYTILLYLIMRDLSPTWGVVVWLPASMVGGLLLLLLDNLFQSLADTFSCDTRMTPNDPKLNHAGCAPGIAGTKNNEKYKP
jgi:hypothetical protein